jgi:hypothetical protein
MKKILSVLFSPLTISIGISVWYFFQVGLGSSKEGFFGDPRTILVVLWLFLLLLIGVVVGISSLFYKAKITALQIFAFFASFLVCILSMQFSNSYSSKQLNLTVKQHYQDEFVAQSNNANTIIAECNAKFNKPEKVLDVKNSNDFIFKLEDGSVSLFYLTSYPNYEKFTEFAKNNLIGKEVSVKCISYDDLIKSYKRDGLILDMANIPVILSLDGMILNTSPYINFRDNQGIDFNNYIQDNYFPIQTSVYSYKDDKISFSINYLPSLSVNKNGNCSLFTNNKGNQQASICVVDPDVNVLSPDQTVHFKNNVFYRDSINADDKNLLYVLGGNLGLFVKRSETCESKNLSIAEFECQQINLMPDLSSLKVY